MMEGDCAPEQGLRQFRVRYWLKAEARGEYGYNQRHIL